MVLTKNSITFGKYKGYELPIMLRDRDYCKWLCTQDWFAINYEYLKNQIETYNPIEYFIKPVYKDKTNFLEDYEFFNLVPEKELEIELKNSDKICYGYYLKTIEDIKDKIYERLENDEENIFDIKAPTKWLKNFEINCGMPRENLKEFIKAYDLLNITTIIKQIKKEGGIEYKGDEAYKIAKKRSIEQEKWWEIILKEKYGDDIGVQFKYKNCIFDFINISSNTILECKLGLKDINENQYIKYKIALEKYKIIYLISTDCIICIKEKKIFTTNSSKYKNYIEKIKEKKKNFLEELILNFIQGYLSRS